MQVSTAEFKKGLRIVFDGQPYAIVDFQHEKPGKGGAFVRTKLKHMRLGKVIDNTFRAGEKVELVEYDEKHMQFLYKDDRYHFMDTETYEQVSLSADEVGDARAYLKENTEVDVLYIDGVPTTVDVPNFVELAIASTDPGLRGDTAQGGTKRATLETGAVVQVPPPRPCPTCSPRGPGVGGGPRSSRAWWPTSRRPRRSPSRRRWSVRSPAPRRPPPIPSFARATW